MTSIHLDKYMVKTTRGYYVKTDSKEGIGYVMFDTRAAATEWATTWGEDCYVVKVRATIKPSISGRTERMVAVHKAGPQVVPQAQQEFEF
jgi:hypothetical protein